ncbi:MAG: RbsD/FucU family protein [Clostridiales bacterium]|nr:RbsD/FucU family protein [Clostridiales bacterium]
MLKRIDPILSPELLKVLCEMGHGDTIVLADANFPAESIGRGKPVLRCDGHGIPALLSAVLSLFPLDTFIAQPVTLMQPETKNAVGEQAANGYAAILMNAGGLDASCIRRLERFAFYQEARAAYAVIATGELAPYANIILQKGVVQGEG